MPPPTTALLMDYENGKVIGPRFAEGAYLPKRLSRSRGCPCFAEHIQLPRNIPARSFFRDEQ